MFAKTLVYFLNFLFQAHMLGMGTVKTGGQTDELCYAYKNTLNDLVEVHSLRGKVKMSQATVMTK